MTRRPIIKARRKLLDEAQLATEQLSQEQFRVRYLQKQVSRRQLQYWLTGDVPFPSDEIITRMIERVIREHLNPSVPLAELLKSDCLYDVLAASIRLYNRSHFDRIITPLRVALERERSHAGLLGVKACRLLLSSLTFLQRYDEAEQVYREATPELTRHGNEGDVADVRASYAYLMLAKSKRDIEVANSVEAYERLAKKGQDYFGKGLGLWQLRQYKDAANVFSQMVESKNHIVRGNGRLGLGVVLFAQSPGKNKVLQQVEDEIRKGIRAYEECDNHQGVGVCEFVLSKVFSRLGARTNSIEYGRKAVIAFRQADNPVDVAALWTRWLEKGGVVLPGS